MTEIKPIGVDLEETLICYSDSGRNPENARMRPGAIVLLEGLRKMGFTPVLDTMSDDVRTQAVFDKIPRLKKYFPPERMVTVTNRKRYDTHNMPDNPRKRVLENLNEKMAGGKNPTEYGANLLVDDMRSPIAEEVLGFRVIQIPSPEDDSTMGWAHRALEAIAKLNK